MSFISVGFSPVLASCDTDMCCEVLNLSEGFSFRRSSFLECFSERRAQKSIPKGSWLLARMAKLDCQLQFVGSNASGEIRSGRTWELKRQTS